MKISSFAAKLAAILILVLPFTASAIDQNDLDKYIKSIELLKSTDNSVIKSIENSLSNNPNFRFDVSSDGSIKMMSQFLSYLAPEQKTALDKFIKKAGYSSTSTWTDIGDKVSAAMMAVESGDGEDHFSDITPEMIQAMPKEMREQIEGAKRMFEALKNVPQADIDLIEKNKAILERVMG